MKRFFPFALIVALALPMALSASEEEEKTSASSNNAVFTTDLDAFSKQPIMDVLTQSKIYGENNDIPALSKTIVDYLPLAERLACLQPKIVLLSRQERRKYPMKKTSLEEDDSRVASFEFSDVETKDHQELLERIKCHKPNDVITILTSSPTGKAHIALKKWREDGEAFYPNQLLWVNNAGKIEAIQKIHRSSSIFACSDKCVAYANSDVAFDIVDLSQGTTSCINVAEEGKISALGFIDDTTLISAHYGVYYTEYDADSLDTEVRTHLALWDLSDPEQPKKINTIDMPNKGNWGQIVLPFSFKTSTKDDAIIILSWPASRPKYPVLWRDQYEGSKLFKLSWQKHRQSFLTSWRWPLLAACGAAAVGIATYFWWSKK